MLRPVNAKELLEQGSLGMFGDRYSGLSNELQVPIYFVFIHNIWLCHWYVDGTFVVYPNTNCLKVDQLFSSNFRQWHFKDLTQLNFWYCRTNRAIFKKPRQSILPSHSHVSFFQLNFSLAEFTIYKLILVLFVTI